MFRRPQPIVLVVLLFVAVSVLLSSAAAFAGATGPVRVLLPLVMNGYQPDITLVASSDAFISEGTPSQNFGAYSSLFTGNNNSVPPEPNTGALRSLIRFNLPALSAPKLTRATLRIYFLRSGDPDGAPPRKVTLRAVTGQWEETAVTWDTRPGQSADEYGSLAVSWADPAGYRDVDVTALVREWYAGSLPNNGLYLTGPEVSGSDASVQEFASREWVLGFVSHPPELILTF